MTIPANPLFVTMNNNTLLGLLNDSAIVFSVVYHIISGQIETCATKFQVV